ncbi:hypothetical protein Vi05172_g12345 [Venturia inaequalis]|nr:hypothetical protein Vi05172_g12345 [Venturia inaequalis]
MRFPLLIAVLITAISAQAPAAASNCTQAVDAIPECGVSLLSHHSNCISPLPTLQIAHRSNSNVT